MAFIRAKCPDAKLSLTLCTPLNDLEKDAVSRRLNGFIRAFAAETKLPMIDLYTPLEAFDRNEHMTDVFHWKAPAIECQAEIICSHIRERIAVCGGNVQLSTETGPDGAMK